MDILENLSYGFSIALTLENIFYVFIGVCLGIFVGALPGLGPTAGMAVVLPLTFGLPPIGAIIMLAGIYYGAFYGGSITSILINTPGDSAAVVTVLDGYPMALKGRAGAALSISALSSFCGATFGIILLMLAAPAIADLALHIGQAEYFSLVLFALVAMSGLASGSVLKSLAMTVFGLCLGMVGIDALTGTPRFTFGSADLLGGIYFVPVAVGLFGVAEIINSMLLKPPPGEKPKLRFSSLLPTRKDLKESRGAVAMGSAVGFSVGALPGAGATIATFISYSIQKKVSPRRKLLGTGMPEGVAAPESANSASTAGAMIPMLALGVPGSAATAVLLGVFILNGIQPGPQLITGHPDVFWGLVASMYVGVAALLVVGLLAAPMFASVLKVPYSILAPVIMGTVILGTYAATNSLFDVAIVGVFGLLGVVFKRYGFPAAPLILALVLGPILESSFRRALELSRGDLSIFVTRPTSATLLAMAALVLIAPWVWRRFAAKRSRSRDSEVTSHVP